MAKHILPDTRCVKVVRLYVYTTTTAKKIHKAIFFNVRTLIT